MSAAYTVLEPPVEWAGVIDSIWVQEAAATDARGAPPTTVLPTGTPELLVYFGDPFVEQTPRGAEPHAAAVFGGQRSRAIVVRATGRTGVVAIRFHPWGAAAVTDVPVDALLDRFVPLDELYGARDTCELLEQVHGAASPHQRAGAVLEFLARRRVRHALDAAAVRAAIEIKRADPSIGNLGRQVGVGPRQLRRRFRETVGIGPKAFSRLLRLQEAIWHRRNGAEWSDVAFSCGYHDQAHLIHAWRDVTATSPARCLDRRPESALGRFYRTGRGLTDFYNTAYL